VAANAIEKRYRRRCQRAAARLAFAKSDGGSWQARMAMRYSVPGWPWIAGRKTRTTGLRKGRSGALAEH
jgi:hypothetical protein